MKLTQCLMPGALGLLAWMGLAATGCDDSNTNPMPDDSVITAPRGGKSASSQSGSKAGKGGEAAAGKAGQAGQAQGSPGGQGGISGGSGGSSAGKGGSSATGQTESPVTANLDCKDKTDCYCGAPKQQTEFLNQCTDAMCTHYDNAKLKKWNGEGAPPPLP
jgi:hypothetical protein